MNKKYDTPVCPCCGEECHVCIHEKTYEDENGEWITE